MNGNKPRNGTRWIEIVGSFLVTLATALLRRLLPQKVKLPSAHQASNASPTPQPAPGFQEKVVEIEQRLQFIEESVNCRVRMLEEKVDVNTIDLSEIKREIAPRILHIKLPEPNHPDSKS